MDETATDRLVLAVTQVDDGIDIVRDDHPAAADLPGLFACLHALADACYQTFFLAKWSVEASGPEHPIHATPQGRKVQGTLRRIEVLYGAAADVVDETERLLRAIGLAEELSSDG
ncbi:MAG: hypothetical protein ACRDP6_14545 [Actinoallomurus sp.]